MPDSPRDRISQTMDEPFIGDIKMFAGNFAPVGWAFCDGAVLSIAEHEALFTIIGTMYGGDGQTTFALPDLRGRIPVGIGQGPGLGYIQQGETGGEAEHTLTTTEMPAHTHGMAVSSGVGTSTSPVNNYVAMDAEGIKHYSAAAPNAAMHGAALSAAGGSQPHNNMQPFLSINFIICLEGYYPPQS